MSTMSTVRDVKVIHSGWPTCTAGGCDAATCIRWLAQPLAQRLGAVTKAGAPPWWMADGWW